MVHRRYLPQKGDRFTAYVLTATIYPTDWQQKHLGDKHVQYFGYFDRPAYHAENCRCSARRPGFTYARDTCNHPRKFPNEDFYYVKLKGGDA